MTRGAGLKVPRANFRAGQVHEYPAFRLGVLACGFNFFDHSGPDNLVVVRAIDSSDVHSGREHFRYQEIIACTQDLIDVLDKLNHTSDYRILTKEDTRRFGKKPVDLALEK